MKIRIAHSPDSDDAFMFYGLATGQVPSPGYELEHVLSDIETLNRAAFDGTYEITAVSFHAYAYLAERYLLLPHGASFGDGYGPVLVVSGQSQFLRAEELGNGRIAIPGRWTSAALALSLRLPGHEAMPVDFQDVGRMVKLGKADGGLVIHEGQLTARVWAIAMVRSW